MQIMQLPTSGWGGDVMRGLDHPQSRANRLMRMEAAQRAAKLRKTAIDQAVTLIEGVALKPEDTARILRALAGSIKPQVGDDTRFRLAELADEIETGE